MAERTESAVISVGLVGKDLKDEGEYRESKSHGIFLHRWWLFQDLSLRRRRLEVVGTRKNGRSRRRQPLACLPRARPFSLSPSTSKRLLRRLSRSKIEGNADWTAINR